MKKKDILVFDYQTYNNDYLGRSFALDFFQIKYNNRLNFICSRLFSLSLIKNTLHKMGLIRSVNENGFYVHDMSILNLKFFNFIEGYWQTQDYFNKIRNQILHELKPNIKLEVPNFISLNNSVAVHVRRTDYLKDDRYGFLGKKYYHDAMELMKRRYHDLTFIFFSDDINWCKIEFGNNLENVLYYSSEINNDCVQLYFMSKCKHQIIANSSFSWWAAWLNTNENKMVIRPVKPFNDHSLLYENHYPNDWIKIENSAN